MPIGSYFYNIDIRSAYWQIAFRLGYISEKMFKKYVDVDSYKKAKRYCISFLARTNRMQYTSKGVSDIVICDTTLLRQVYNNIRSELYKVVQDSLANDIPYIEYNIDGVSVMKEDLQKITDFFSNSNIKYKITECKKVSEHEYLFNGFNRVFIRRKRLHLSNV